MNCKRGVFYFTISIVVPLLLINIGEVNSFPSDLIPQIHSDGYLNELQSILERTASLIIELRDRQRQLNNLIEETGNGLTGNEDKVVDLGEKIKKGWLDLKASSARSVKFLYDKDKSSEEQRQEAMRQQETVKELRDDVFATLVNAKLRKCKSEDEAFYEPLSKCFKTGEPLPDDPCPTNQWFYEVEGTNDGICDCKDEGGFTFYNQSEECYQLHTQGPCETGDWLIFDSRLGDEGEAGEVTCESVPDEECKLDGSQVYYAGKCATLGTDSGCNGRGTLERDLSNWGRIRCSLDPLIAFSILNVGCRQGFKRTKDNKCRKIFRHEKENNTEPRDIL